MKFKVSYVENGMIVTEYLKTESAAKKRAKQMGGTWAKLGPNE